MTEQATLPMLPETPAMGSHDCSTSKPVLDQLLSIPARLTDDQLAMVEEIACLPLPALQRTDERHLAKCMTALDANLPRRATDVDSGALRIATWARMFGEMPREQVEFMCRNALLRHTFFPTVAEFLTVAKEWRRGDDQSRERSLARARLDQECEARRSEIRQRLRYEELPQAEINALPMWLRESLVDDRVLVSNGEEYRQSRDWRAYQAFVAAQGSEAA